MRQRAAGAGRATPAGYKLRESCFLLQVQRTIAIVSCGYVFSRQRVQQRAEVSARGARLTASPRTMQSRGPACHRSPSQPVRPTALESAAARLGMTTCGLGGPTVSLSERGTACRYKATRAVFAQ